jgi:hypothetical protein
MSSSVGLLLASLSEDDHICSACCRQRLPQGPSRQEPAIACAPSAIHQQEVYSSFEAAVLEPIVKNRYIQAEALTRKPGGSDPVAPGKDHTGKRTCQHNRLVSYLSWCSQNLTYYADYSNSGVFPPVAPGEDPNMMIAALQRLGQP